MPTNHDLVVCGEFEMNPNNNRRVVGVSSAHPNLRVQVWLAIVTRHCLSKDDNNMIKVIAKPTEIWTLRKIQSLLSLETAFLKKQIRNIQDKIGNYERLYGKNKTDSLYGGIDDMELLEWEGEIETLKRLEKKLTSLEEIRFEYE